MKFAQIVSNHVEPRPPFFKLRKKNFKSSHINLNESQGCTIREACEKVGISRTTYYKLKNLREEKGLEALATQTYSFLTIDYTLIFKIRE
jgi:hypothetical protein